MAKFIQFSDINQETPTTNPLVENLDAIYQSIYNILETSPGERLFNPEFGVGIEDTLGDIVNEDEAMMIFHKITEGLDKDPRIELDIGASDVYVNYDNNSYEIKLVFYVAGEDKPFEFNLNI